MMNRQQSKIQRQQSKVQRQQSHNMSITSQKTQYNRTGSSWNLQNQPSLDKKRKCEIHDQELVAIYLGNNKLQRQGSQNGNIDDLQNLLCYECIHQKYSENMDRVVIFKQLKQKQKEELERLFDDKNIYQLYLKVQDYRLKFQQGEMVEDQNINQLKENYKLKFKQIIKQLENQIELKIDDIFENYSSKSIYLMDQLFQKFYPIEDLVLAFENLRNTNQLTKQIVELQLAINEIKTEQNNKNDQILSLEKIDDDRKISEHLDKLYYDLECKIKDDCAMLLEKAKFIDIEQDITKQHSFQPLMKLTGDDMQYNSQYWTNGLTLNADTVFNRTKFEKSIVYESFSKMNIKQILLECVDQNGDIRYTVLQKTKYRPLLAEFQQDKPMRLRHIDGETNPLSLMGITENVKILDSIWRINSYQCNTKDNFRVRLGGFFLKSNSVFDKDKEGFQCSHEVVGLGITDGCYKNSKNRFRSAGVRQFNDRNTLKDQKGQLYANINVYGR